MATIWTHRLHLFVRETGNLISAANSHAANWDPDTGGALTFINCPQLQKIGNPQQTWRGCSTAATDAMRAAMSSAKNDPAFAPGLFKMYDAAQYTWEQALADAGLEPVPQESLP